jgi:DNA-binding NtrC family response regulator
MGDSSQSAVPYPMGVDGSAILCVDDEPRILTALERTLGREPYAVYRAMDAPTALEILEGSPIKVVIADQRMPGMAGSDLLYEIGRRWPQVGKIILTGFPGKDVLLRGMEAEIDFLMTKPWDEETLRRAIRRLILEVDRMRAGRLKKGGDSWHDLGGEGG